MIDVATDHLELPGGRWEPICGEIARVHIGWSAPELTWTRDAIVLHEESHAPKILSTPSLRAVGLHRGVIVVLTEGGEVLHLEDTYGGRLVESEEPDFDRYELELAAAEAQRRPRPASPLRCLEDAHAGTIWIGALQVTCGGYGRSEGRAATLRWNGARAAIHVSDDEREIAERDARIFRLEVIAIASSPDPEPREGVVSYDACHEVAFEWNCVGIKRRHVFVGPRADALRGVAAALEAAQKALKE
jgi:hypothetical protein